mgnify:CR=1 FL=1
MKLCKYFLYAVPTWSPPVRRRGLKRLSRFSTLSIVKSPPVRRRGLKHLISPEPLHLLLVASRAEAWIETSLPLIASATSMSPPVRRRGLKHNPLKCSAVSGVVASRAEAWIETQPYIAMWTAQKRRLPCGGVD